MKVGSDTVVDAGDRLAVLDGWRAVSILLVLASHLIPLGPRAWHANGIAGAVGMAIFFTLSGFLITRFLIRHPDLVDFLIRRACRILPLAWLGLAVGLGMTGAPAETWRANLLFIANLPPAQLPAITAHYWSLCIEVQFYAAVALIFALASRRGLAMLPYACVAVTLYRMLTGAQADIVTWHRIDEILAGCTLALALDGQLGAAAQSLLRRLASPLSVPLLLIGLAASSHPDMAAPFRDLKPYLAALLVGGTLHGGARPVIALLESRTMAYVATISFALYVWHHLLIHTWLGQASDKLALYLKRPLLIGATFAVAHLSTFHFEQRFIALGRRLSALRRTVRH